MICIKVLRTLVFWRTRIFFEKPRLFCWVLIFQGFSVLLVILLLLRLLLRLLFRLFFFLLIFRSDGALGKASFSGLLFAL